MIVSRSRHGHPLSPAFVQAPPATALIQFETTVLIYHELRQVSIFFSTQAGKRISKPGRPRILHEYTNEDLRVFFTFLLLDIDFSPKYVV